MAGSAAARGRCEQLHVQSGTSVGGDEIGMMSSADDDGSRGRGRARPTVFGMLETIHETEPQDLAMPAAKVLESVGSAAAHIDAVEIC